MKTRLLLLILSISLFSCKDKYADLPDGLFAEINTSKGTVIAELEFNNIEEATNFDDLPPWIIKEVTDDPFYLNCNLAF